MNLSSLGIEPITADQPSGTDVRYDPLFGELQREIDRTALPSAAGAVDWEKVVQLSAEILSQKSKDLLVAGYLAVGLIHTRKLDGLTVALQIYRDLLEHHAADLFPQRERGRLRSIEWWLEKCEAALKQLEDESIDPAQLNLMEEALAKVERLLREMLPDAPSLKALQDCVRHAAASTPAEKQVKDAGVAKTPAAAKSPVGGPIPQAEEERAVGEAALVVGDGRDVVEDGLRRLRAVATLLREQDVANPLAYRLSRQSHWLAVSVLPPVKAGRTMLPPPSTLVRNRLADLRRVVDGKALVNEIEAQLGQFIFWLDLNRLAAETLAGLGAGQAALAVGQETAFLIQRLPGLDELAFADGTPFADEETSQWLRKHLPTQRKIARSPVPAPADPNAETEPAMGGEVAAASALIAEGNLIEAIERLQERLKNSGSERERIQWRLALSRVLIDAEQAAFALPHLEQAVSDIDTYRLEIYDPTIALEAAKLAWHGFQSQPEQQFQEKAKEALHRIARIDLAEMVRLSKGETEPQMKGGNP